MAKRAPSAHPDKSPANALEALAEKAPICLLWGPQRKINLDLTAAAKRGLAARMGCPLDDVQTVMFEASQVRCSDVLDECRSLGLMSQAKLVIVDRVEALLSNSEDDQEAPSKSSKGGGRSNRELLAEYAKQPEPSCVLVLRGDKVSPGKLKEIITQAGGLAMGTEEPTPADAIAWAISAAKRDYGMPLTKDAVAKIVENIGADIGRIDAELAKLSIAATAYGKKQIDLELVEQFSGFSRSDKPWAIHLPVLRGDEAKALEAIDELIEVSRLSPVAIVIFLTDLARKLDGIARGIAAKEGEKQIINRVRVFGNINEQFSAAQALGPRRTARLMRMSLDAFARITSGRGEPEILAQRLAVLMSRVIAQASGSHAR